VRGDALGSGNTEKFFAQKISKITKGGSTWISRHPGTFGAETLVPGEALGWGNTEKFFAQKISKITKGGSTWISRHPGTFGAETLVPGEALGSETRRIFCTEGLEDHKGGNLDRHPSRDVAKEYDAFRGGLGIGSA
jgi:hypothetical protein